MVNPFRDFYARLAVAEEKRRKKKQDLANPTLPAPAPVPVNVPDVNQIPASVATAKRDIENNPNLTEEQKKLAIGRYNVERAKASGGKSLSIAREEERAQGQKQIQQAAQELSFTPQLTEQDILAAVPQEEGLEKTQAGVAGAIGGVAGASLGAAKIGGALGTVVAPGVGTAIGAGIGGIIGAVGGAYTKISYDKIQDVKQAKKVAQTATTNFGQTIDALNAGTITKDVALERFRNDRIALYAARENLKRETDTDLNRFLSNGADELTIVEDQVQDLETIYTQDFLLALAAPNPANVKYVQQNVNLEEQ